MTKKLLSLVLAVLMVIGMIPAIFAGNSTHSEDSAEPTVEMSDARYVSYLGIIKGYSSGSLALNDPVNRWMMALLAVRIFTGDTDDASWLPDITYTTRFEDVKDGDVASMYLGAIAYCSDHGFIRGIQGEDGKWYYKPYDQITYRDALVIAVRLLGYESDAMNAGYPTTYTEKAYALGLADGISGVELTEEITRGTAFQIIYNVLFAKRANTDVTFQQQFFKNAVVSFVNKVTGEVLRKVTVVPGSTLAQSRGFTKSTWDSIVPAAPTGYKDGGYWSYADGSDLSRTTATNEVIYEDTTFYVDFAPYECVVNFVDGYTGETIATFGGHTGAWTLTADQYPALPTNADCEYTGWDMSGDIYVTTKDITVKAQYATNKYAVSFVDGLDDKAIGSAIIVDAQGVPEYPEAPAHDGYTFAGWDVVEGTKITGNTTITATYTKDVIVTFQYVDANGKNIIKDGEPVAPIVIYIKADTVLAFPEVIEADGYEFNCYSVASVEDIDVTKDNTVSLIYKTITKVDAHFVGGVLVDADDKAIVLADGVDVSALESDSIYAGYICYGVTLKDNILESADDVVEYANDKFYSAEAAAKVDGAALPAADMLDADISYVGTVPTSSLYSIYYIDVDGDGDYDLGIVTEYFVGYYTDGNVYTYDYEANSDAKSAQFGQIVMTRTLKFAKAALEVAPNTWMYVGQDAVGNYDVLMAGQSYKNGIPTSYVNYLSSIKFSIEMEDGSKGIFAADSQIAGYAFADITKAEIANLVAYIYAQDPSVDEPYYNYSIFDGKLVYLGEYGQVKLTKTPVAVVDRDIYVVADILTKTKYSATRMYVDYLVYMNGNENSFVVRNDEDYLGNINVPGTTPVVGPGDVTTDYQIGDFFTITEFTSKVYTATGETFDNIVTGSTYINDRTYWTDILGRKLDEKLTSEYTNIYGEKFAKDTLAFDAMGDHYDVVSFRGYKTSTANLETIIACEFNQAKVKYNASTTPSFNFAANSAVSALEQAVKGYYVNANDTYIVTIDTSTIGDAKYNVPGSLAAVYGNGATAVFVIKGQDILDSYKAYIIAAANGEYGYYSKDVIAFYNSIARYLIAGDVWYHNGNTWMIDASAFCLGDVIKPYEENLYSNGYVFMTDSFAVINPSVAAGEYDKDTDGYIYSYYTAGLWNYYTGADYADGKAIVKSHLNFYRDPVRSDYMYRGLVIREVNGELWLVELEDNYDMMYTLSYSLLGANTLNGFDIDNDGTNDIYLYDDNSNGAAYYYGKYVNTMMSIFQKLYDIKVTKTYYGNDGDKAYNADTNTIYYVLSKDEKPVTVSWNANTCGWTYMKNEVEGTDIAGKDTYTVTEGPMFACKNGKYDINAAILYFEMMFYGENQVDVNSSTSGLPSWMQGQLSGSLSGLYKSTIKGFDFYMYSMKTGTWVKVDLVAPVGYQCIYYYTKGESTVRVYIMNVLNDTADVEYADVDAEISNVTNKPEKALFSYDLADNDRGFTCTLVAPLHSTLADLKLQIFGAAVKDEDGKILSYTYEDVAASKYTVKSEVKEIEVNGVKSKYCVYTLTVLDETILHKWNSAIAANTNGYTGCDFYVSYSVDYDLEYAKVITTGFDVATGELLIKSAPITVDWYKSVDFSYITPTGYTLYTGTTAGFDKIDAYYYAYLMNGDKYVLASDHSKTTTDKTLAAQTRVSVGLTYTANPDLDPSDKVVAPGYDFNIADSIVFTNAVDGVIHVDVYYYKTIAKVTSSATNGKIVFGIMDGTEFAKFALAPETWASNGADLTIQLTADQYYQILDGSLKIKCGNVNILPNCTTSIIGGNYVVNVPGSTILGDLYFELTCFGEPYEANVINMAFSKLAGTMQNKYTVSGIYKANFEANGDLIGLALNNGQVVEGLDKVSDYTDISLYRGATVHNKDIVLDVTQATDVNSIDDPVVTIVLYKVQRGRLFGLLGQLPIFNSGWKVVEKVEQQYDKDGKPVETPNVGKYVIDGSVNKSEFSLVIIKAYTSEIIAVENAYHVDINGNGRVGR